MGADEDNAKPSETCAVVEGRGGVEKRGVEHKLPYLQACLFVSAIEDTIAELQILAECNNELRIHRMHSDMHTLRAVKYGVKQIAKTDELDGIDRHNLASDENKLNKLDADRMLMRDTFVSTYKWLWLDRSYGVLARRVAAMAGSLRYHVDLAAEEEQHRVERREMTRALRFQRNHIKTVIYDTGLEIEVLKNTLEDSVLNAAIRTRYVGNFQEARKEMHQQDIINKEADYAHGVEYFKTRSDHEQRVHSEIELLVTIIINETLERVESWMNKYDKDIEDLDLKIQLKKNEYFDQMQKRTALEQTIEVHQQQMAKWKEFCAEREKVRQHREKMTRSALTVQAWWRGLMLRQQLGPYKPKKKKAGDKKKK